MRVSSGRGGVECIAVILLIASLAAPARAGDLEWSIGGGIDRTVSRQGDTSRDVMVSTGVLFAGRWRRATAGVAADLEISEGFGLRLGVVLGLEHTVSARTRVTALVESGVHSVTAQDDARAALPYAGVRIGIDHWRSTSGGRSHGLWLAWQQDLTRTTATHSFEVCSLLGSCHTEQDDYDLGGWAVMIVYRLGHVSR
jgi:hypothetical protein